VEEIIEERGWVEEVLEERKGRARWEGLNPQLTQVP
jgi:hypothetical protein